MRISKPLGNSAAIAALFCLPGAGDAQQAAPPSISESGSEAMERLRDATTRTRDLPATARTPILPDLDHRPERRRAFEGLGRRQRAPDMEARARAAHSSGEAGLAVQRERQAKALRQALGLEPGEAQSLAKAAAPASVKAWVPVLLISSSVPIAVLRTYAQQLERVRGVLALRGMPGGMKKAGPLAKLTAEILRLDPGCEGPACKMRDVQLIVDPMLFRQHGVSRVPALIMLPGDPTQPHCERDAESAPLASHTVYGDSALAGLFEEYARLGGKEEVAHAQALLGAR